MSTKIVQIMTPSTPLQIRFDKLVVEGKSPLIISVEFIALVDYDGQTELEYAAILDGQMLLFNVDGHEVAIQRYEPIMFQTSWKAPKDKYAKESYGL